MRLAYTQFKSDMVAHGVMLASIPKVKTDLRSAVAQHICVSGNGLWETYLRACVKDYFRTRCDAHALRIIERVLKSHYNLKASDLSRFFASCHASKRTAVEDFIDRHTEFADGITSIVANKNKIAHEGQSGVSADNVADWVKFICADIDAFHEAAFL